MIHYAFLVKRPQDKFAWPTIFVNPDMAMNYPHRVSTIVRLDLVEGAEAEPAEPPAGILFTLEDA